MQDSIAKEKKWGKNVWKFVPLRGGGPTPYGKNILNFHVDYLTAPLRLTCDDLDQGRQAPSTFLLDYRRPQEGLKIQHDFLAFNFHQHYQSITYVIIIDHSLATETKQTKCPRPLCIFEPALVNNKWLAGSQSSNVAAKSKWQDQICPQAPKSAAKALHRVHIFAPKQLAGAADQNILVENN